MPPFLGGLHVPGPQITSSRYGLLTVTEPVTPDDDHWMVEGIIWDEDLCSGIHSTTNECPIPISGFTPRITDHDFQSCTSSPFTVYASYDCPPVGRTSNEAFAIAEKRLNIRESSEVERIFWTGLTESGTLINPSLAFGNSECGNPPINLTPNSGPLSPTSALAALESNLAECVPGTGVIHANYGLANFLAANHLIYENGDAWFTVTGQRLALGAGYPGSGPANTPSSPGTTWAFATGPIMVLRSQVFLTPERYAQAVDASINSVQIYAERVYAIGWSCCLFAVQVCI